MPSRIIRFVTESAGFGVTHNRLDFSSTKYSREYQGHPRSCQGNARGCQGYPRSFQEHQPDNQGHCRKAGIRGSKLDLITDCLRFTLHFFRPIQMSAQHIYHTALPLSPETSILRSRFYDSHPSWKKDRTTRQASSSTIPPIWGPILRTIKADLGSFTHVAVAGQKIVAVCEDNTVNVYDAVTGVLKPSLNPPWQVTKAEGSPDGSILFFAHQSVCEITVWDTQTGGLIYTLTTTFEISDIAVSLGGKYLASCSSDGTFRSWKVESRCGDSHSCCQAIVCIR